ncbi:hypothetical protein KI387_016904, partial [Taxus chinensis]
VEVKCGKPVNLNKDSEKGRLHLTQATLGLGSSGQKSVVQCNVGDRPGVLLCSLLSGKTETCSLNLQFEEEEVIFSVLGPTSVHLTGYYISSNEGRPDVSDISGEDIAGDSEDFNDSSSDDDYEEDFIDDDDDVMVSLGVPNTGVRIEEIEDEEASKEQTKDVLKKKKKDKEKQKTISLVKGAVVCSKSDIIENESVEKLTKEENQDLSESEDGDGFPICVKRKSRENGQREPLPKKQVIEGNFNAATVPSELTALDVPKESKLSKRKKKKVRNKKGNPSEMEITSGIPNNDLLEKIEQKILPTEKMGQEMEHGNNVRTFPNGLVIEELSMGKPDGKKAAPGSKVSVYYTGKLKKNGKLFDSNIGRKPFQFRLGVGEVISGWDVGVNGMRIGDKRRLTIPPSMGYGAKGAGEIPGNA